MPRLGVWGFLPDAALSGENSRGTKFAICWALGVVAKYLKKLFTISILAMFTSPVFVSLSLPCAIVNLILQMFCSDARYRRPGEDPRLAHLTAIDGKDGIGCHVDYQRCPYCGWAALGSAHFHGDDPRALAWSGKWPGQIQRFFVPKKKPAAAPKTLLRAANDCLLYCCSPTNPRTNIAIVRIMNTAPDMNEESESKSIVNMLDLISKNRASSSVVLNIRTSLLGEYRRSLHSQLRFCPSIVLPLAFLQMPWGQLQ